MPYIKTVKAVARGMGNLLESCTRGQRKRLDVTSRHKKTDEYTPKDEADQKEHEVSKDDKKIDVIEVIEETGEVTKNETVVTKDNGISNGTSVSHDNNKESHDQDNKSHVIDEVSHDQDEKSHDIDEESHDQEAGPTNTVSHDQGTVSDVTSDDNTVDAPVQETESRDQSCDPEEQPPSDNSWEILNESEGNKEQVEVVANGVHLENGHDEVSVANGDLCDPSEGRDSRWSFPPVLDQFDLMDTETDPAELEAIFADERLQEIYLDVTPEGPGLGISIVGGQGSPSGDLPIIVKRVLPGSLAEQDGRLKSGDELVAMNEKLLVGVGKDVAIDALSNLEGNVRLLVLQDE